MGSRFMYAVLLALVPVAVLSNGTFWQITDVHVDSNYSETGNPGQLCHGGRETGGGGGGDNLGHYGNFSCDAPWSLLQSAVKAMQIINDEPDFVLWTGDNSPHVNDDDITSETVFSNLRRVTALLEDTFPSKPIIPVIGNHDVHPANEFPDTGFKDVYQAFLTNASWENHIPPEETVNFRRGGYYARDVSPGLRVVVVNTNLYLSFNSKRGSDPDPGGQLAWLRKQLKLAQDNNTMVIVAGHVPPGYFERQPQVPFLASPYNEAFIGLMVNYSRTIMTQVYGHSHTDTFRLFSNASGVVVAHAFVAPSVTPWSVPGTGMRGINPSVRLFRYAVPAITDYEQYFLNLTVANRQYNSSRATAAVTVVAAPPSASLVSEFPQNATDAASVEGRTDSTTANGTLQLEASPTTVAATEEEKELVEAKSSSVEWELLYRATAAYKVPNLNLTSMGKIYLDVATQPQIFDLYYRLNTAGVAADPCDAVCRKNHICALRQLTPDGMTKCLTVTTSAPTLRQGAVAGTPDGTTTTTTPVSPATLEPTEDEGRHHHRHHNPPPYMKHVILGTALALLSLLVVITVVCMRRMRFRLGYRYTRHFSVNSD